MEWVRLDPGNELIALIRLRQPETVLAAQLERSKDVLAQSAAIVGLAAIRPVTYGVVNALRACMQNGNFYCRCSTVCFLCLCKLYIPESHNPLVLLCSQSL